MKKIFTTSVLLLLLTTIKAQCPEGYEERNVKCNGKITVQCIPQNYTGKNSWVVEFAPCPGRLSGGSFSYSSYEKALSKGQNESNNWNDGKCTWYDNKKFIIYLDDSKFCSSPNVNNSTSNTFMQSETISRNEQNQQKAAITRQNEINSQQQLQQQQDEDSSQQAKLVDEYSNSKIFLYSKDQGKGFFKKTSLKSWGEFDYSTGNKIFTFSSIEETNSYILLYDESRKIYVKLTENTCLWGYNTSQIRYKVHDGYWTTQ